MAAFAAAASSPMAYSARVGDEGGVERGVWQLLQLLRPLLWLLQLEALPQVNRQISGQRYEGQDIYLP